MKYIKTFQNENKYIFFRDSGTMNKPNMSYCVEENSSYYNPVAGNEKSAVDLSRYYTSDGQSSLRTTANCYIVRSKGTYMFPLVYGNALYKGKANTDAYTNLTTTEAYNFVNHLGNKITSPYIEEHSGCTVQSVELLDSDLPNNTIKDINVTGYTEGSLKFVTFTVGLVPDSGGNAVIGIKDENSKCIWSWHIWVVPDSIDMDPVTVYNGNTLYEIMPYNLASVFMTGEDSTYQITDGEAKRTLKKFEKNWLYQFGRKDPFNYSGSYTIVSGDTLSTNVYDAIANPRSFYCWISTDTGMTGSYDWNVQHSPNLWDASMTSDSSSEKYPQKTIYDPCPIGYCVPMRHAFYGFTYRDGSYGPYCLYYKYSDEVTTNATEENINAIKRDSSKTLHDDFSASSPHGYLFKRSANDAGTLINPDTEGILFPATGYLSSSGGAPSYRGWYGYCWSCAPYSSSYAYFLSFSNSNVDPQNVYSRAYGFSVRPLREPSF